MRFFSVNITFPEKNNGFDRTNFPKNSIDNVVLISVQLLSNHLKLDSLFGHEVRVHCHFL